MRSRWTAATLSFIVVLLVGASPGQKHALKTLLLLTLLGSVLVVAPSAQASVSCTVTVSPGQDIQAAIDSVPAGSTICIESGTYAISATLVPQQGDTLYGQGHPRPLIDCSAVLYCIDGSAGPSGVSLKKLGFEGAGSTDVRTGDGWKLVSVQATDSAGVGIAVSGTGVVVSGSYAADNGQFGLRAVKATNLTVTSTEVAFNPTNPSFGTEFSGGAKFNGVVGLIVKQSYFHDNGGEAGLWLDIDTKSFRLTGDRSLNNTGENIRIEISCYGVLKNDTTGGGGSAGGGSAEIDLVNSHNVTVQDSSVSASAADLFGVRMISNGRTTSPGTGACMTSGAYQNANNQAVSNQVTMPASASSGVIYNGGVSTGNSWSANAWSLPSCDNLQWQWWDGTTKQRVDFAGWQGFGQDLTGSCTASA